MSTEGFVGDFATRLRAKGAELREYGASEAGQACERIALDLEEAFRTWWLARLTVSEAAAESGYSEERLREMAREGSLPHGKGEGSRGHLTLARCDLPRRPKSRAPASLLALEERLMAPRARLRK